MWNYTATWNKHDSATIARDFYRMGAGVPEQTESLEKGFVNLRTQGYHHSDIHEIKACITGGDTAWAGNSTKHRKYRITVDVVTECGCAAAWPWRSNP